VPNFGALPIIASVSLAHLPYPFACFYESVLCGYVIFSTCRSTCVARGTCFVFCSIFITTFVVTCSFFYKSNGHYVLFSTCLSSCVASAAWSPCPYVFVLCSWLFSTLISMFLFPFFSFRNLIDSCVTVSLM